MLNEIKIKEYCDTWGFSYRYFNNDTALIMTGVDTWRITEQDIPFNNQIINRLLVEHSNKFGNRKGKIRFHTQRIAYDVDWVFENIIIPHQNYDRVFNKAFKVKELLQLNI